ncbi:Long-chain-alcohol dehydrogenase 1 [bioreactor metagenome]|uniref:Long-chain-alcohol dehydrogenase 1 n=1 Tax=bioreactor metagenome TaxID=1076179 RepID=A0A644ZNC3_9ZZZZ
MFSVRAMELILEGFRHIGKAGPEARFDYLDEFVTASMFAGIAFLKAGCGPVHALSFPLGGMYHVPHGESNYALFGKILELYDEGNPNGELLRFKQVIARILDCTPEEALKELSMLEEKVLPLKPLRSYGFTQADIRTFPVSVEENQQRLLTNAYVPMTREMMERVYRECF